MDNTQVYTVHVTKSTKWFTCYCEYCVYLEWYISIIVMISVFIL